MTKKPRIRIRYGVWRCHDGLVVGYGPIPIEAYRNWVLARKRVDFFVDKFLKVVEND